MRHVSVHIKKNKTQCTQRREFNIVDALLNHTYCWYIIPQEARFISINHQLKSNHPLKDNYTKIKPNALI